MFNYLRDGELYVLIRICHLKDDLYHFYFDAVFRSSFRNLKLKLSRGNKLKLSPQQLDLVIGTLQYANIRIFINEIASQLPHPNCYYNKYVIVKQV